MKKVLFILLTFLAACHTNEIEVNPSTSGHSYFPLEKGRFAIYDIEETIYSLTSEPISKKYQVKEIVAEKFTDLSNQEAYKIYRYSRTDSHDTWKSEPDSIWTAKAEAYRAIRTENNVTFVKLIFPAKQNIKWDGNRLNNQGKEEYMMQAYKKPFQIMPTVFENTLTVTHSTIDDLCNQDLRYEVYADNIGLIYKEKSILHYQQIDNQCSTDKKVNYGILYTQRLIEHGK